MTRPFVGLAFALLTSACLPALSAQAPDSHVPPVGLLVVAHGADSGWNARVRETVARVDWPGPVALAFLMGDEAAASSWDAGLDRLEGAGIGRLVVVPLMVSSAGAHTRQIRHYAGEAVPLPDALMGHAGEGRLPRVPTLVTGGLDAAPELGEILRTRWAALSEASRRRSLMLLAHGPSGDRDADRWVAGLRGALTDTGRSSFPAQVHLGLIRDDAAPSVRATAVAAIRDTITTLAALDGDSVLVMTVLVSSGGIDRRTIPADLAGLPVDYVGSVLAPHPALARWIARVAREALSPEIPAARWRQARRSPRQAAAPARVRRRSRGGAGPWPGRRHTPAPG